MVKKKNNPHIWNWQIRGDKSLYKMIVIKWFAKVFVYIVSFLGVFKVNHLTEKLGETKNLKLKCWDHWLETNVS